MSENIHSPIKVLQVTIGDGSYGGVASFLYSYYSYIDHKRVLFDFLYCGENSMRSKMNTNVLMDSKITTFHIMKGNNNGIKEYTKLWKALKAYFDKNSYDIVHVNTSNIYVSACVAYVLKGRSVMIAHSHNTKATIQYGSSAKRLVKVAVKIPCRKYIIKKADYYFACSKAAGENLFGKKALNSERFKVINNAINVSKYAYNPEVRNRIRKNNKFVFGHVGRLTKQKNPEFLIELFAEIHKLKTNTELWMVGEGEMQEEIENMIRNFGLEDSVVMWGRRNDVADLMQAMDMFLLPSLYEGLSIVAVEAQAAGLPMVASDSISMEHDVSGLVRFLPLKAGVKVWAEKISDYMIELPARRDMRSELESEGYEINQAAQWLEKFYMSI